MDQSKALQNRNEIETNPLGLPTIAANEITERLDRLVASLSVQMHQYLKHHWLVEGPEHRDLHLFFDEAYNGTLKNLDRVAERMTILGAVPTSSLRAQAAKSFIESEADDQFPIRSMVKSDFENEQSLIDFIRSSIELASELNDYGTETLLKGVLLQREEQIHELEHYLSRDSLSK